MNYINWFKSKHWTLMWFILLILLRPIIDCFWWVKDTSIGFSPLQVTGALTFVLALSSIYSTRKVRFNLTLIDKLFIAWGILLVVNSAAIVIFNLSIKAFSHSIKLSFPLYLYFYLRYAIRNEKDFRFILQTFLISTYIPLIMILFEMIFFPLNPYTPGGRNLLRYRGLYADGVSYTIYWMIALIVSSYFFLSVRNPKLKIRNFLLPFCVIVVILFGLLYLTQYSAYGVFIVLLLTFLIFSFWKNSKLTSIFFVLLLIIAFFHYKNDFNEKVYSLAKLDVQVIKGDASLEAGANGRVGIWLKNLNEFRQHQWYSILFGWGFDTVKYYPTGAAAHNDLLRMLFATGLTGLVIFLLLLVHLFLFIRRLEFANRYLLLSTLLFYLTLSIALTPTFYYPFMYFMLTIISFLSSQSRT